METSGRNIIWMLFTGIIFCVLAVLMDMCDILNWIFYVLRPVPTQYNETLDEDVVAEMQRLKNKEICENDVIQVKGLEKVYGIRGLGTPVTAVKVNVLICHYYTEKCCVCFFSVTKNI